MSLPLRLKTLENSLNQLIDLVPIDRIKDVCELQNELSNIEREYVKEQQDHFSYTTQLLEQFSHLSEKVSKLEDEVKVLRKERDNLNYRLIVRDCVSSVREWCFGYLDKKYFEARGAHLPSTFTWSVLTKVQKNTLPASFPMTEDLQYAVANCISWIHECLAERQVSAESFWKVQAVDYSTGAEVHPAQSWAPEQVVTYLHHKSPPDAETTLMIPHWESVIKAFLY